MSGIRAQMSGIRAQISGIRAQMSGKCLVFVLKCLVKLKRTPSHIPWFKVFGTRCLLFWDICICVVCELSDYNWKIF